ncbi:hypothetical protein QOZ80_2BG0181920 [Eleusine coracana subsp. coracana]|nr:hypothetical protein QOZ80_2BG0181920 [Eleusine coracana subsp. coracana]
MGSLPLEEAVAQPLDPEAFSNDSHAVLNFLAEYYRDLDKYPVRAASLEPGRLQGLVPDAAPEWGESMDAILDDVRRDILPGQTHWQSPSFFAYFPMNTSSAGFAGEMLSAGLNVVPLIWAASPAAAELEGNTCEAVVCKLPAARDRALGRHDAAVLAWLVVYASDQTHVTFQKGAWLVGIPPANFRVIAASAASGHDLTGDAVRKPVEADVARGMVPLYLCAMVGAVDPMSLSRWFRAIKLWVVLRRYGAAGLRAHIRRHVTAAKWFEGAVAKDERFQVVAPSKFSLVCFRLIRPPGFPDDGDVNDVNRELLATVNATGRAFMTHFVVDGTFVIRLAVCGAATEMRHVRDVRDLMQRVADDVLIRRYQS